MLVEDLILHIPEIVLLQTNTDGATFRFDKKYLDQFNSICKGWEGVTKLNLEQSDYSKMIIRDVNNYIGIYTSGKVKCKGSFEWEDLQNHKYSSLSKNKSHLIIPKAIYNYFVNNIIPEQYLASNRNIFDYCGGVKSKGAWYFKETCVVKGVLTERKLQKVVRYYVSNKGCKILKYNPDGRQIQIEAGPYLQTEFNQFISKSWEEYDVDESYYLDHIYNEIANISPKKQTQLQLF